MDSNPFKIQRLKGSINYDIQSLRIETILIDKDYINIIVPTILIEDADKAIKEASEKSLIEKSLIEKSLIDKRLIEKSLSAAAIIKLCLEEGPLI